MSIKIARTLRMALEKRLDEIDHLILIGAPHTRHRILEANHILHTLTKQIYREATKSNAEREDEGAEKLIRRDPKKRERRTDLRKNRVEFEKDPDLQGLNRGDGGDPDLSRRDRKMATCLYRLEHRFLTLAKIALKKDNVSEQARQNLRGEMYRDRESGKNVSFETAYTKGNPKAVEDLKKETMRIKNEEKKEELNPLNSLSGSQKQLFREIAKGKEISSLTFVEELVLQETISSLIEVKEDLEKKGVVEPPLKKRKTRSDKGVPRGPYTKKVKEELEKRLPEEISGESVSESVDIDTLSCTRMGDAKALDTALSTMVETSKKEDSKSKSEKKNKLEVQEIKRKRKVEKNKLRNEQELREKMSEVDPESLNAIEDEIKDLKDQASKESDSVRKKILQAKIEAKEARFKSLSGGSLSSEKAMLLLERVKGMGESELEELRATQEPMEQEFINKAVTGDMEGLLEEVGGLSDFDPEGSSPSDIGAFMARSKAKDAFIDDPLWQYPLPPSDPKNRSEHEAHVFNTSYLNFSKMGDEDRERVDASTMAKKKELELKLLEASEEDKKQISGELENVNHVRSALNTAHLMEGGGYGKTEPLEGFHEVPKDIVDLAKKSEGSPSMLKMVSTISNHGASNVDMRESTREALSGTSDEDFTEAMGGSTGPYADLLKMLEPTFCPPSLKNTEAKEGECPEPMTDEDRQVIRDVVTTIFLDGQSLQRMQDESKKKPIKKPSENKDNKDTKDTKDQPKRVDTEEYQSILFEDGSPSKEDFEEFESFIREDNLVRLQEEQGLPSKIQKAVNKGGRPRKKPGDPKGKYTRSDKPQEALDEIPNAEIKPEKNKGGRPRKKPGDPKGKYTRREKTQEEDNELLKEIRKRHEALWSELERDFG